MKRDLLQYLVCPLTGESFNLEVLTEEEGQVKEGRLISQISGTTYPISGFVPRFVNADEYTESFSEQRLYVRKHFDVYRKDGSGNRLFYGTTGFSRDKLLEGLLLEVGCGYGRFIDVVQREGAEIIGIDLSTHSIDLAQSFVGLRPKVHLIQCDLFRLPFRQDTFASIYSIGVLHHTADCKKAFQSLPLYLKPNGQISVWLYHPDHQSDVTTWRKFTTTWSPRALYWWCIFNQIAFSWVRMLPIIRWKFNRMIPGSVPKKGQSFWLRVMEDFDNLSPKYASSHVPEEVVAWFEEMDLKNIKTLQRLTSITGFRRSLQNDQ